MEWMMTLSERFLAAVEGRKAGRTCQVEHPEWSPMDDVAMKYFIPAWLRRVYWSTKKGEHYKAWFASKEIEARVSYDPYLWRLPVELPVSQTVRVKTAEVLQMIDRALRLA